MGVSSKHNFDLVRFEMFSCSSIERDVLGTLKSGLFRGLSNSSVLIRALPGVLGSESMSEKFVVVVTSPSESG